MTISFKDILKNKRYGYCRVSSKEQARNSSLDTQKLSKDSLKNQRMKKEYQAVKDQLEQGIHPVDIGRKSAYADATKVLVKKKEGRYMIDVSDTSAEIIGISVRSNPNLMANFERLMNEIHGLDIKGYS